MDAGKLFQCTVTNIIIFSLLYRNLKMLKIKIIEMLIFLSWFRLSDIKSFIEFFFKQKCMSRGVACVSSWGNTETREKLYCTGQYTVDINSLYTPVKMTGFYDDKPCQLFYDKYHEKSCQLLFPPLK